MKIALSTLVLLAVLVAPSLAALTDYQSGFEAGLKSGFSLGKAYQQSTDGKISIQQYNQVAASYNALIQSLFAGNQAEMSTLLIGLMSTDVPANVYPVSSYANKPVHAIDASWNQTNRTVLGPQGQTIHGEPIDAYCTQYPDTPACQISNTPYTGTFTDKNGVKHTGTDQPLGGV